jgi:two-component system, response regulator FlrC
MDTINVELFGRDPKVVKAISAARNVSVTKAPILIVGETGIGKKTLARFIHQNSPRAHATLEFVDCSEAPQEVENKILGNRDTTSGKFTKGALEVANKGTVVFCNIDCLEEGFQKKLTKILSELSDYDIDIRLIATTTKNLSKLVGAGRFYRGLYSIIGNNTIALSPLRERVEDLEQMARRFVSELSNDLLEKEISISSSAMDKILSHYWTQNAAELKSVLENSLGNVEGEELSEHHLTIGEKKTITESHDDQNEGIRLMSLRDAEQLLIKKALVHTSENRTQAAKILGVSIRTLRNKINEYRNEGHAYFLNLR